MDSVEKNKSSLLELIERNLWADWIEEVYLNRKDRYFPFEIDRMGNILSSIREVLIELRTTDDDLLVIEETKSAFKYIFSKNFVSPQKMVDSLQFLYVILDDKLGSILKEVLENFFNTVIHLNHQQNEVRALKSFFTHLADLLLEWRIKIKESRNNDHQQSFLLNQFKNIINAEKSVLNYNYRNANGDNPYWYYILVFNLIISDKRKPSIIARTLKELKKLAIDEKEYNRREGLAYKALNYVINTNPYFEQLFKEDMNDFFDSEGNRYKFENTFKQYLKAEFFVEYNQDKLFELPKSASQNELRKILNPALAAIHSDSISFEKLIKLNNKNNEEHKNVIAQYFNQYKEEFAEAC